MDHHGSGRATECHFWTSERGEVKDVAITDTPHAPVPEGHLESVPEPCAAHLDTEAVERVRQARPAGERRDRQVVVVKCDKASDEPSCVGADTARHTLAELLDDDADLHQRAAARR